ncbi:hypothetical protein OIV83_000780 [Microbotryomycetes sp. JL201]|nr:hypothetical protein OIV83_000780 [Microbotryomycetes sp. JL201]
MTGETRELVRQAAATLKSFASCQGKMQGGSENTNKEILAYLVNNFDPRYIQSDQVELWNCLMSASPSIPEIVVWLKRHIGPLAARQLEWALPAAKLDEQDMMVINKDAIYNLAAEVARVRSVLGVQDLRLLGKKVSAGFGDAFLNAVFRTDLLEPHTVLSFPAMTDGTTLKLAYFDASRVRQDVWDA